MNAAILPPPCPPKTRDDLEWQRVLDALADRCVAPAAKRNARALPFLTTLEGVRVAHEETREAMHFDSLGDGVPTADLVELDGALDRARVGALLSNEELRGIVACLRAARFLRKYLASRRARMPALTAACSTEAALDEIGEELGKAFDPDGTLSDRASPALGALRADRKATRDRLVRRLEELAREHADILQDGYWTERDGRYVLPVRSDAHERFPGIVHASSQSGATVFVEPRVLVDQGNRLKLADALVEREERTIYLALSALVAEHVERIASALAALLHADLRAAAAKLASELGMTLPTLLPTEDGIVRLRAAKHPLLALDGVAVVPSDVSVTRGQALVVSGPNAGGKTVALKALGLAALLVRAGLPIPAAEGSEVSVVELVLTDVGDDQNLHKNLSSFSAHVQNVSAILDQARPGAIVLLDEVAAGTDPREGEALAAAILDSLCARGASVAATTHYEALKALALTDTRFVNASVSLDLATMSPTFRLVIGVPGASSALAVARRFGMPETVTSRAQSFLSREALTFDEMVHKLEAERRALELSRADAKRAEDAARARKAELDRELERLAARESDVISRDGQALVASIKRARDELRLAQARVRGGRVTDEELAATTRAIDAIARKTSLGGELEPRTTETVTDRPSVATAEIRVGLRVYVPKLRAEAEVIEVLGNGQLRVAAGPLKLSTNVSEIRALAPVKGATSRPVSKPGRFDFDAASDPEHPIQTPENSIDLRGLRAHEAAAMAEQFLDRSLGAGRRVAFLIHGHGTGASREAVRDAIKLSRIVSKTRAGGPREGGDGVTVVWLK
jgi:DNA mismatch repair protein MutS2